MFIEFILLARRLAKLELTTGDKFSIGPKKFSALNNLNAAVKAPYRIKRNKWTSK
jgi:hypothetical protein